MESLAVETEWFNDFKKELPKVEGKVFAITGTTSGTGFIAARTVAELGGTVLLLNRPSERATKSLAQLKEAVPEGKFVTIDCDLQSFASVRNAADEIIKDYSATGLDAVCWNAGIMAQPDKATVDGYDTQMQTNHLSHFLLTALLFPLLKTAATARGEARIVNHSSGARHMTPNHTLERRYLEKNGGNLDGDAMDLSTFSGPCFLRYHQTKLANAVFTKALHEKLTASSDAAASKIKAYCADPGMSATSLGNHFDADGAEAFKKMAAMCQTSEDGTMGILKGMLAPDAVPGAHYGPAKSKGPVVINEAKPYESDPNHMALLWETSEAATGVTFAI